MKKFNLKKLVLSISSVMALGVASVLPISQASDIEIYREPQLGDTTIMFMLDISTSMSSSVFPVAANSARRACELPEGTTFTVGSAIETRVSGAPSYRRQWCNEGGKKHYDRITRLKDAMIDVLYGNPDLGITRINDDKIIGLSTLGSNNGEPYMVNGSINDKNISSFGGAILVPARRLDEVVNGKTQRQILLEELAKLEASTFTPTTRSFAETVAYLFGTTTAHSQRRELGWISSNYQPFTQPTMTGDFYSVISCVAWDSSGRTCTGLQQNSINVKPVAEGRINSRSRTRVENRPNGYNLSGYYYDGPYPEFGFDDFSRAETKNGNVYRQPEELARLKTQPESIRSCSTQGIYVLTDGVPTADENSHILIRKAIQSENFRTCGAGDSFACAKELSSKILLKPNDPRNLANVQIKTAVVGFGGEFDVSKYPNVKPYVFLKKEDGETEDAAYQRRVAYNKASVAGITNENVRQAAEWGIEGDGGWYSGNSSQDVVQSIADFLATLNTSVQTLPTGAPTIPVDALNAQDFIKEAFYAAFTPRPDKDFQLWLGDMNKFGLRNGKLVDNDKPPKPVFDDKGNFNAAATAMWKALGNLPIQTTNGRVNSQRKLLTNRTINGHTGVNGQRLQTVNLDSLFGGAFNNDPYKNHWLNALGYNLKADVAVTRDTLPTVELRQMGATMHSSPVFLTQEAKIVEKSNGDDIDIVDRKDFVLYGSTQGMLHVLDVKTGVEKFAFVPHEMLEKQRGAFLSQDSTFGGKNKLFYGIDGAWTAHTIYHVDEDDISKVLTEDRDKEKAHQWVYGGLRMGGKSYYALDLSDIDNPEMKFHINPEQGTVHHSHNNQTTTYQELQFMGQSWSRPTLGYVNWRNANNEVEKRLVMFVGGGYDEGYETTDYKQNNGVGAGVYMFDANTGELLWWASNNNVTNGSVPKLNMGELKYSVASRINAVDRDQDGLIDNLYFGDLAGQAFRIDLNNKANDNASFGHRGTVLFTEHKEDGTSPRFYEMPSIAVFEDEGGGSAGKNFATVSFVSGDRSSPYSAGTNKDPLKPDDPSKEKTLPTAADGVFVVYDNDLNKRDLYDEGYKLLTNEKTLLDNQDLSKGVPRRAEDGSYNRGWKHIFHENLVSEGGRPGSWKGMGEPTTFVNHLYVTAYDKDKVRTEGQCGSGVIGVSNSVRFCLPTGICDKNIHGETNSHATMGRSNGRPYSQEYGPGIVYVTVAKNDATGDLEQIGLVGDAVKARIEPKITKIRWYESK